MSLLEESAKIKRAVEGVSRQVAEEVSRSSLRAYKVVVTTAPYLGGDGKYYCGVKQIGDETEITVLCSPRMKNVAVDTINWVLVIFSNWRNAILWQSYDFSTDGGNYVTLNTDQTISGKKTFTNIVQLSEVSDGTNSENATNIIKKVKSVSNPNLLINSNFAINQRGRTSYTTPTLYTVDRWKQGTYGTVIPIDGGGITLNANYGSSYLDLRQYLEASDSKKLIGKTITVSLQLGDGTIISTTVSQVIQKSGSLAYRAYDNGGVWITYPTGDNSSLYVQVRANNGTQVTINWVKLEVGDVATAYTPPLIAEELPKCQRYYQLINNATLIGTAISAGYISVTYQNTVEMRIEPTLSHLAAVTMRAGGVSYTQSSASSSASYRSTKGGMITLSNFSNNPTGIMYQSMTKEDVFSLDAEIY